MVSVVSKSGLSEDGQSQDKEQKEQPHPSTGKQESSKRLCHTEPHAGTSDHRSSISSDNSEMEVHQADEEDMDKNVSSLAGTGPQQDQSSSSTMLGSLTAAAKSAMSAFLGPSATATTNDSAIFSERTASLGSLGEPDTSQLTAVQRRALAQARIHPSRVDMSRFEVRHVDDPDPDVDNKEEKQQRLREQRKISLRRIGKPVRATKGRRRRRRKRRGLRSRRGKRKITARRAEKGLRTERTHQRFRKQPSKGSTLDHASSSPAPGRSTTQSPSHKQQKRVTIFPHVVLLHEDPEHAKMVEEAMEHILVAQRRSMLFKCRLPDIHSKINAAQIHKIRAAELWDGTLSVWERACQNYGVDRSARSMIAEDTDSSESDDADGDDEEDDIDVRASHGDRKTTRRKRKQPAHQREQQQLQQKQQQQQPRHKFGGRKRHSKLQEKRKRQRQQRKLEKRRQRRREQRKLRREKQQQQQQQRQQSEDSTTEHPWLSSSSRGFSGDDDLTSDIVFGEPGNELDHEPQWLGYKDTSTLDTKACGLDEDDIVFAEPVKYQHAAGSAGGTNSDEDDDDSIVFGFAENQPQENQDDDLDGSIIFGHPDATPGYTPTTLNRAWDDSTDSDSSDSSDDEDNVNAVKDILYPGTLRMLDAIGSELGGTSWTDDSWDEDEEE